jgi:hypothetical protein
VNNFKKLFIITLILAMVTVLCACSSSTNLISSAAFEKETIGSQDSTGLTVQIANSEGKTQVIDTEVLRVMVNAPRSEFTVEPIAGSAETLSRTNELKVSLKPGAVLPRDFKFNIAANGAPAGEYAFTVTLNAGEDDETSLEVSLTVE